MAFGKLKMGVAALAVTFGVAGCETSSGNTPMITPTNTADAATTGPVATNILENEKGSNVVIIFSEGNEHLVNDITRNDLINMRTKVEQFERIRVGADDRSPGGQSYNDSRYEDHAALAMQIVLDEKFGEGVVTVGVAENQARHLCGNNSIPTARLTSVVVDKTLPKSAQREMYFNGLSLELLEPNGNVLIEGRVPFVPGDAPNCSSRAPGMVSKANLPQSSLRRLGL